jgi:hypothetical protein
MNSIIDNQRELVPTKLVVSEEFIRKCIGEIADYIVEVYNSDVSKERKIEIAKSSLELMVTIANQSSSIAILIFCAVQIKTVAVQVHLMISKPTPKFQTGGVTVKGTEIITNKI